MPKKISQAKIAEKLGVSQSLVSIVLNGRKEGIAKETYDRIWDYALKHGYSPKGMKLSENSAFGGESMQTVGYFLRAPLKLANKSNFFSHVAQGLHDFLRGQNYKLVFLGSEMDISTKELANNSWRNTPLTGVVIMGEVNSDFLGAVRDLGKPLVYLSARSPGFCHSVNGNEYQAAEQLVDHLYELGHRHFAFLGGMVSRSRNDERLHGLQRALARYNLNLPDEAVFIMEDAERKQGYQMAGTILQGHTKNFPTAWMCVNGLVARGALSRLFQEGLNIGEDVSVAAFDNTRVCAEEIPGITSAASIPENLGREAGRILLNPELHEGDSLLDIVLPSKFVVRESSGPALPKPSLKLKSLLAAGS
ncbi:LacI family transcriptional regulator [Puniceicoccales bacterium CK1056]|uniref:LacI family transcriptional regulator n=1 Tax=Oceanipulchritudo coccoides TaxID=2706888 RepID=A0A6B2M027_9BACT|nr:LacI family DNA-binding transcriptional regulator [Oceanipulchritudo coccoides]NDV62268.1 LacI family transcriptional regulator [Oceanipulchritudo coccoides]